MEDMKDRCDSMIEKTGSVWRCMECGRLAEDSRAKANLRRHVETHMEGLALPCTVCGTTSSSTNGLSQHMAKKHSELKPPKVKLELDKTKGSPASSVARVSVTSPGRTPALGQPHGYPAGQPEGGGAMNYSINTPKTVNNLGYSMHYAGMEGGMQQHAAVDGYVMGYGRYPGMPYATSRSLAHNPGGLEQNTDGSILAVRTTAATSLAQASSTRVNTNTTTNIINYSIDNIRESIATQEPAPAPASLGHSKEEIEERAAALMEKRGEGTGSGVWACTECGKTSDSYKIRRHVEVHMKDIKFPCKTCGKNSKSSHGLYQHISKQHPEVRVVNLQMAKHKCSICGKPSKTSKGLSNHRWKYHRPGGPFTAQFAAKAAEEREVEAPVDPVLAIKSGLKKEMTELEIQDLRRRQLQSAPRTPPTIPDFRIHKTEPPPPPLQHQLKTEPDPEDFHSQMLRIQSEISSSRPQARSHETQEQLEFHARAAQQLAQVSRQPMEQMRHPQEQMRHTQELLRQPQEQLRHTQELLRQPQEQLRQPQEQHRQPQEQLRHPQEQLRHLQPVAQEQLRQTQEQLSRQQQEQLIRQPQEQHHLPIQLPSHHFTYKYQ